MKKKNWKVDSFRTIGWIIEFIRRYIKIEANESLVGVLSLYQYLYRFNFNSNIDQIKNFIFIISKVFIRESDVRAVARPERTKPFGVFWF